jgi:hypothetical protein
MSSGSNSPSGSDASATIRCRAVILLGLQRRRGHWILEILRLRSATRPAVAECQPGIFDGSLTLDGFALGLPLSNCGSGGGDEPATSRRRAPAGDAHRHRRDGTSLAEIAQGFARTTGSDPVGPWPARPQWVEAHCGAAGHTRHPTQPVVATRAQVRGRGSAGRPRRIPAPMPGTAIGAVSMGEERNTNCW